MSDVKLTDELTKQQIRILRLASYGMTINEIAANLYLEYSTIASHRKDILLKLQAKNMTHAVAIAYEEGLFKDDC